MAKGILILGDKNSCLLNSITEYYKKKERYIDHVDKSNVMNLMAESKDNNIYVTTDIVFNSEEREILTDTFTKSTKILITNLATPQISLKLIKHLYNDIYISHKLLKSGLMLTRLKYVLEYDRLHEYISKNHLSDDLFLHFERDNEYVKLTTINLDTYKYIDKNKSIKTEFIEDLSDTIGIIDIVL